MVNHVIYYVFRDLRGQKRKIFFLNYLEKKTQFFKKYNRARYVKTKAFFQHAPFHLVLVGLL